MNVTGVISEYLRRGNVEAKERLKQALKEMQTMRDMEEVENLKDFQKRVSQAVNNNKFTIDDGIYEG